MAQAVNEELKYSGGVLIIGSGGDINTTDEKKIKLKDISKDDNELAIEYDAQLLKKYNKRFFTLQKF